MISIPTKSLLPFQSSIWEINTRHLNEEIRYNNDRYTYVFNITCFKYCNESLSVSRKAQFKSAVNGFLFSNGIWGWAIILCVCAWSVTIKMYNDRFINFHTYSRISSNGMISSAMTSDLRNSPIQQVASTSTMFRSRHRLLWSSSLAYRTYKTNKIIIFSHFKYF